MQYTSSRTSPLVLSSSTRSQAYGLLALAMALTLVGVYFGLQFANLLLSSGLYLGLAVVELGLIFTATWWSRSSPLNYLLFALFPLISGFTLVPYLLIVTTGYVNGGAILVNAVGATVCMSLSAAFLAQLTPLAAWGRALLYALIGLLVLSLFQLFVPSLQTQTSELFISGIGAVLFSLFLAYDIQRLEHGAALGANPFLLALSLYLDIYNLFIMILRFMTALSGERR